MALGPRVSCLCSHCSAHQSRSAAMWVSLLCSIIQAIGKLWGSAPDRGGTSVGAGLKGEVWAGPWCMDGTLGGSWTRRAQGRAGMRSTCGCVGCAESLRGVNQGQPWVGADVHCRPRLWGSLSPQPVAALWIRSLRADLGSVKAERTSPQGRQQKGGWDVGLPPHSQHRAEGTCGHCHGSSQVTLPVQPVARPSNTSDQELLCNEHPCVSSLVGSAGWVYGRHKAAQKVT